jgi:DNA-binding NarL/FixJ family response regulator
MSFTETEILLFELEVVTSAIERSNCQMRELMTLVSKLDDIMDKLKFQVILDACESGKTYTEIAEYLGVSRQAVSQYMRNHGVKTINRKNNA